MRLSAGGTRPRFQRPPGRRDRRRLRRRRARGRERRQPFDEPPAGPVPAAAGGRARLSGAARHAGAAGRPGCSILACCTNFPAAARSRPGPCPSGQPCTRRACRLLLNCNNVDTLLHFAESGLGIAALPDFAVRAALSYGPLAAGAGRAPPARRRLPHPVAQQPPPDAETARLHRFPGHARVSRTLMFPDDAALVVSTRQLI